MQVERIQPDYTLSDDVVKFSRDGNGASTGVQTELPGAMSAESQEPVISTDLLASKVEQLNETMQVFKREFHFKIHEETSRIIVQVLNAETDEVVSEIPPEKVLDILANMEEAIGLIVDKKA
jgi:flagellar protein FlaG